MKGERKSFLRLSEYRNEVKEGVSVSLEEPIVLTMSRSCAEIVREHEEKFRLQGLCFRFQIEEEDEVNLALIIERVPKCLTMKEDGEREIFKPSTRIKFVRSLVEDVVNELKETRGGCLGVIPKTINYVLNSRACRGAIKFGDKLQHDVCDDLIKRLSECDLPFQCAHGRPSVAPLINLAELSKKLEDPEATPNFSQLRRHVQQLD